MPLNRIKAQLATAFFKLLFLPAPELTLTDAKIQAFDRLFQSALDVGPGSLIDYQIEFPKHEFLRYLVTRRGVLLHGSNRSDLDTLLPKEQTDWSGKRITAVFATGDGIWPVFFAVLDLSDYRGSLRNGCFVVAPPKGELKRFYFFSINADMLKKAPWIDGTIYILPREPFESTGGGVVRFDEWASPEPVKPLARLPVSPEDFILLPNVTGHDEGESVYISWIKFKRRQR